VIIIIFFLFINLNIKKIQLFFERRDVMSDQLKLHDDANELSLPEARLARLKVLRDKVDEKAAWNGRGDKKPPRSLLVVDGADATQIAQYLTSKGQSSNVTFEVTGHKLRGIFDDNIRELEREIADAEKANQPDPMDAVKEMQAAMQAQQAQFMKMMIGMMSGNTSPEAPASAETAPEETPAES
jgi:hypothetical protein